MIEYKQGDILREDVEALVNPVNCVGVMGAGLAYQFDKAFPANSRAYKKACSKSQVKIGRVFIVPMYTLFNPKYIFNFPTKRRWQSKSRLVDIEAGMADLIDVVTRLQIKSIAIPPLGCGLGGLSWKLVKPLLERAGTILQDVKVVIFEPASTNEEVNSSEF